MPYGLGVQFEHHFGNQTDCIIIILLVDDAGVAVDIAGRHS